jgi:hypothetical protein
VLIARNTRAVSARAAGHTEGKIRGLEATKSSGNKTMHASLVNRRRMDDAPDELALPGMGTSVGPPPGSLESNRSVLSPNHVGDDLGDHAAPPDDKAHLPPHLARADRTSPAPSPASLPLSHVRPFPSTVG